MKKLVLVLTMLLSLTAYKALKAQERIIKGNVTDKKNGDPMVGAYVSAEDKNGILSVKASVAQNGSYSVKIGKEVKELVFSYVSYTTVRVKVGKEKTINVQLEETKNALREDVVIRGYVKRSKEVQDVPVGNVEQLLQESGRAR